MNAKEVYAKALHLLSVRFLSEGELRRKLQAREAADDVIDEVVEKLKTERFIDDERLAAAVYRHYAQKAKYGHAYICNKLRLRLLPLPEEREEYDETEAALLSYENTFPGRKPTGAKLPVIYRTAVFRERLYERFSMTLSA